jgi:hypothetical protein
MQAVAEARDDAEVAAAAAKRPEEVRALVRARPDDVAVGEHDVRLEQVVDREPVLPRQVPVAAAEREPADSGRRDDPADGGEPVLVRGAVDLAPGATAAHVDRAGGRVDGDLAQQREVADDAVVDAPEAWAVVAAAVDRQREALLAREADDPGDLGRVDGPRDQGRPLVDHRVVEGARLVVVRVLGTDQLAREPAELRSGGRSGRCHRAHAVLLSRFWIIT